MALPLAITAVGLISSVGRGAVESCASIRAGINRVGAVPHFSTLNPDLQEPTALQGHPITGITDGFAPSARWLMMARYAIDDLKESLPAGGRDRAWSRCGVVFVLPVLGDARFFHAPPAQADVVWASCLDPILASRQLAVGPAHKALVSMGAGGIARAFQVAGGWIEKRAVERVLVVAVDSLLDAWSLDWLASAGRLKDAENPVGLAPGEAAVALLLQGPGQDRDLPPLARTRTVIFEEVDEPFQNPERRQGRGLATALRRALAEAGGALDGDLYVNLNGEDWRAAELGTALAAFPAGTVGAHRIVVPATSVGDVGAAAGALHVACALHSFARGYALASHAWSLATSDDGDVSALCLEAA
jgi:3-oxoacyl-[acyl-carrier-protein] synthase-1